MANSFSGPSSRFPDLITVELVAILTATRSFDFKTLFDLVQDNLRLRNPKFGGGELFRLKIHEKLQALVGRGLVEKILTTVGKEYRGLSALPSPLCVNPTVPLLPV